jgi:hypothetical protein
MPGFPQGKGGRERPWPQELTRPWSRRQKFAPRGPPEALHPAQTRRNDWVQPSEQANMLLGGGGDRANGPQNAPMLRRRIIAVTEEHFEGHKPYNPPQKAYSFARGVVPYQFGSSVQDPRPLVGLQGPIFAGGGHGGCCCRWTCRVAHVRAPSIVL